MPLSEDGFVGEYSRANDPYYNPFATSSQVSFTSAIKPKDGRVETRPGFRRRGSESAAQKIRTDYDPSDEPLSGTRTHTRASTSDGFVGSSSGAAKVHPLASLGRIVSGNSSRTSLIDTRPRLRRMVSDIEPEPNERGRFHSPDDSIPPGLRATVDRETIVIVHEVSPKDSLAGVALRYGISMAELRKANQLWPSDPIHLRKVLYIPLDKAYKAKHLVLEHLETTSKSASETQSLDATNVPAGRSRTLSPPPTMPFTIRRMPASQLSFFPPSSSRLFDAPSTSAAVTRTLPRSQRARDRTPFDLSPSFSSAYSDLSSAPQSSSALAVALQPPSHINGTTANRYNMPALTSLFNSLPLARLSFDSGTSTPTQGSDEQEHELAVVGSHTKVGGRSTHTYSTRSSQRDRPSPRVEPRRAHANSDLLELDAYPSSPSASLSHGHNESRSTSSSTSKQCGPVAYTTPERNTLVPERVRTSQLEPSPAMQVPLKPRRDREVGS